MCISEPSVVGHKLVSEGMMLSGSAASQPRSKGLGGCRFQVNVTHTVTASQGGRDAVAKKAKKKK